MRASSGATGVTRIGSRSLAAVLVIAVAALSALFAVCGGPASGRETQFPPSPKSGDQAAATLEQRRMVVAQFLACGDELDFWRKAQNISQDPGAPLNHVLAKMLWLILMPDDPVVAPEPKGPALRETPAVRFAQAVEMGFSGTTRFAATGGTDDAGPAPVPCTNSVVVTREELAQLLGDRPPKPDPNADEVARLLDQFGAVTDSINNTMTTLQNLPAGDPANPQTDDAQTRAFKFLELFGKDATDKLNAAMANPSLPDADPLAGYGPLCANIIDSITMVADGAKDVPVDQQLKAANFKISYTVSKPCLRRQINFALAKMQDRDKDGIPHLGSSDLPCIHVTFNDGKFSVSVESTHGEWDATVRDLIRVAYIDRQHKSKNLLLQETARHVTEDLINLDGAPGLTSYALLLQCGNQEDSTGSSQDRNSEHNWLKDTLGTIGDLFSWLLKRLALVIAAAVALGLLNLIIPALAPLFGALATILVPLGLLAFNIRAPESENHLLNIETTRYLMNQIILEDLASTGDDRRGTQHDQEEIKSFLMDKFQEVLKGDFEEYNARPYSRYSLNAVLNIAQFARTDPDLQMSARMVLDYVTAKAAVASSQSRRLVPYRRKMASIDNELGDDVFSKLGSYNKNMFQIVNEGDHVIPYMLFHTGQTQQMPDELLNDKLAKGVPLPDKRQNMVPVEFISQAIWQATVIPAEDSPGPTALLPIPDVRVLDIAIDKTQSYEQQIKNAAGGVEIYSSGKGWLFTAGGIETGPANVGFLQVIGKIPLEFLPKTFKNDDRGAGWPTFLMLTGGTEKPALTDLVRIEGVIVKHPKPSGVFGVLSTLDDSDLFTFDGNLCVGAGVACGFNVKMPTHFEPVKPDGSPDTTAKPLCDLDHDGDWSFFDTAKCWMYRDKKVGGDQDKDNDDDEDVDPNDPTKIVNRTFVAVLRTSCPTSGCNNFGVVEAISISDPVFGAMAMKDRFATFKQLVAPNNRNLAVSAGSVLSFTGAESQGVYVSAKGNRIRYDATFTNDSSSGNLLAPSLSRIITIDEKPPHEDQFASGDIMNGKDGKLDIGRAGGPLLRLDLSDEDNPTRSPQ